SAPPASAWSLGPPRLAPGAPPQAKDVSAEKAFEIHQVIVHLLGPLLSLSVGGGRQVGPPPDLLRQLASLHELLSPFSAGPLPAASAAPGPGQASDHKEEHKRASSDREERLAKAKAAANGPLSVFTDDGDSVALPAGLPPRRA